MAKFNEVLKKMFAQTGVNMTDATLVKILDNPAFASLDVDDAMSTTLTAERFSLDAAKNNPELLKHFKAQVLNGVDAEVYRIAEEFGLEDADKTELKSAESSFKRISAITKQIEKLTNKKSGVTGKDKDVLTQEIAKLNADILLVKTDLTKQLSDKDVGFETERTNWKMESIYNNFIPKMDAKNDAKINRIIASTIVSDELAKKGLKVINKDGNLSLSTSTDTEYFENNSKVGLEDFVSKTLANAKLLNASTTTPAQKQNQSQRHQASENPNGLRTDKAVAMLDAMIAEG